MCLTRKHWTREHIFNMKHSSFSCQSVSCTKACFIGLGPHVSKCQKQLRRAKLFLETPMLYNYCWVSLALFSFIRLLQALLMIKVFAKIVKYRTGDI